MKARPLIILAVFALVVVGAAMWFLQSSPTLPPLPTGDAPKPAVTAPASRPDSSVARTESPEPAATSAAEPSAPKSEPPPMAEWEVKIDQVLRTNVGETETAQILINMLPTLPAEGQSEAAQHISNLIQDKDYNRVMPLLRNTNLPEEVHDVFVTDLMNREDGVKLPALLEIAKLPNHPHHEEAQTDLQIFLDEDYGSDWGKWDSAVKAYIRKQQAEEAEAGAAANPAAPGR